MRLMCNDDFLHALQQQRANLIEQDLLVSNEALVYVSIGAQQLYLFNHDRIHIGYPVSTSRYGSGNREGSYQTPLGLHRIAEKIGEYCAYGEIFKARQATGKIASIDAQANADQDLITSRILWLQGMQSGFNLGGEVDSYRRYIYIHGTTDEVSIGQPASIGCIRMRNYDVIALFQVVQNGTAVLIVE